jgi:hypothetical protein
VGASDLEEKVLRLDCDRCKVEQDLEIVRNSISAGMKKERSIIGVRR